MEHLWIIPIIAIAVWILSNLIRPEEPPKRTPVRSRRFPDSARGTDQPSRPLGDVGRFLEEIDNLRKKSEEQRPAERPPQVRRAEPVPRTPPPETARPRRLPIEVVVADVPLPAPVGLPSSVQPLKSPRTFGGILDVLPATVPPPAAPVVSMPTRRVTPAVAQLHAMLQSPQSLRTVMLLQALLEPPRCRKRCFREGH